MKKLILSFVALLFCAVAFVACNSNSPKATADKFLTGLHHGDYEAAKSVSTEETQKMVDMFSQFAQIITDSAKAESKKIKVNIIDEKVDGDKATVTYKLSNENVEKKLDLIKKDDKWLVVWNKMDDAAGSDEEMMDNEPTDEEPMDTTVAPPADAIPDSVAN